MNWLRSLNSLTMHILMVGLCEAHDDEENLFCLHVQVRTLRLLILPQAAVDGIAHGNKRRNYLLLMMAVVQPCLMFWLTSSIVGYTRPVEWAPPKTV